MRSSSLANARDFSASSSSSLAICASHTQKNRWRYHISTLNYNVMLRLSSDKTTRIHAILNKSGVRLWYDVPTTNDVTTHLRGASVAKLVERRLQLLHVFNQLRNLKATTRSLQGHFKYCCTTTRKHMIVGVQHTQAPYHENPIKRKSCTNDTTTTTTPLWRHHVFTSRARPITAVIQSSHTKP